MQNKMSLVRRRKAAVAILILDLLDDEKGSERGKTREWIKRRKNGNVYYYERTKNARYTWVQRDDADGPRAIRPNFASN